ncbi:uncharacterized protein M421DRAFT_90167 [Didymella exigua CBS 183.55]|uniref:CENP-V/GFA domain-containing protein n=1 Tax=Didymella exigua CBS 183.55 TaxID=1150837 RepID=A0A6A5RWP5_9PLEO|nr:uncharacterized protein M421DRAFT_90167 [Didymella exigua CBS 183.55]KAF1931979.1 hypothetical protein M421DRAFT_90167 [Didymella exigua CBS 183.55]
MALDYSSQIQKSADLGNATPLLSVRDSDKSRPYIPRAGISTDGWSEEGEATATCFCGTIRLAFPTNAPGLVDSFVCNYADCRKLTVAMFTSFITNDEYLKHLRGRANLKTFAQNASIASQTLMTNYFCDTCGTLMYRIAERLPRRSLLRLGTVDDFNLAETKLKPRTEIFTKDRVSWIPGVLGEDVKSFKASPA